MGFENINLWFAKDSGDKTILAKEITEEMRHNEYRCPICKSLVIPKLGQIMTSHFAHRDASKCSSETMIHFWVKNELIKIGDKFKVDIEGKITEYECKELKIEDEYKTSKGTYKPDLTVLTSTDEVIYIEIANTNKKKIKDYIGIWRELNNTVVEVEVKDISEGNKINCMKAIYYEGKEYHEQLRELRSICDKEKQKYKFSKEQLDKIDWLINDICKYNNGLIKIDELSDEIQTIKNENERELVINIVKNKRCGSVLDDYVEYNKNKIEKELNNYNENYKFKFSITRLIYDRIFCGCDIEIFYKGFCCGKGFCFYNYESFENLLNYSYNKCKILYGKLREIILNNFPKANVRYLNNSYGESIEFFNTYINLENDNIAYHTVNSLISNELEKIKNKIKQDEIIEKNKKWLNDIKNITYDYIKNTNSFLIYYSCGNLIYELQNEELDEFKIQNKKNIINNRIDVIDICNVIKNKIFKIVYNSKYFMNNTMFPVVRTSDDFLYIDVLIYIRDEYEENIYNKTFKIEEIDINFILTDIEKIIINLEKKYKEIYNKISKIQEQVNNTRNEYEIKIYKTYCLIYNLRFNEVEYSLKFYDVKNIKKLQDRKIFKKILIENFNFYYESNIISHIIDEFHIKYRNSVGNGIWNFNCQNEKFYINGKKAFEVNYKELDSKEKLKSYLNDKMCNYIRQKNMVLNRG